MIYSLEEMSVFFDHRAATSANSVHTDIQWHPSFALLAVATKIDDADNDAQGAVSLFFDEVFTNIKSFIISFFFIKFICFQLGVEL